MFNVIYQQFHNQMYKLNNKKKYVCDKQHYTKITFKTSKKNGPIGKVAQVI